MPLPLTRVEAPWGHKTGFVLLCIHSTLVKVTNDLREDLGYFWATPGLRAIQGSGCKISPFVLSYCASPPCPGRRELGTAALTVISASLSANSQHCCLLNCGFSKSAISPSLVLSEEIDLLPLKTHRGDNRKGKKGWRVEQSVAKGWTQIHNADLALDTPAWAGEGSWLIPIRGLNEIIRIHTPEHQRINTGELWATLGVASHWLCSSAQQADLVEVNAVDWEVALKEGNNRLKAAGILAPSHCHPLFPTWPQFCPLQALLAQIDGLSIDSTSSSINASSQKKPGPILPLLSIPNYHIMQATGSLWHGNTIHDLLGLGYTFHG